MKVDLKVGDKAVYPGHGVGRITSIDTKDVMGSCLIFYSITILESGIKIMFPENRLEGIGVRPVVNKKEAQKVLEILQEASDKKSVHEKNWQKRHQLYMNKIKNGSIYEIAEVIKDLFNIKKDKELSYGEKRMMDKAQNMVYSELLITMDKKELEKIPSLSQPS